MPTTFIYCRSGFEAECAAEALDRAKTAGLPGTTTAKPNTGYVLFTTESTIALEQKIPFASFVFARQWFTVIAACTAMPITDRVTTLMQGFSAAKESFTDICIDTPDTNETKPLSPLCRGIFNPLIKAFEKENKIYKKSKYRAHICFVATDAAYIGYAQENNSSPWPMGIPRLKFPREAPSRSTLKLEEAILLLMTEQERSDFFKAGRRAVDLGAAPGGWSYQLVQRGMLVIAVDNANMDKALMATEMVEHRREDGFHYRSQRPVDWMVCDMIEQPIKIAELVARWLTNGWCIYTIFNLKLPMKKRYAELQRCIDLLDRKLGEKKIAYHLAAKQLYHDRDEVTLFVRRVIRKQ